MNAAQSSRGRLRPWHVAGLVAWVPHLLAVVYVTSRRPGYSHRSQFLSELGERGGEAAAIMNFLGIAPTGILFMLFGAGLAWHRRADRTLLAVGGLIAVHGLGRVLGALFSCDAGCRPEHPSFSQVAHGMAALAASLALTAALFSAAAWLIARRQGPAVIAVTWALGAIAVLSHALLLMHPEGGHVGLYQRVGLGALQAWVAVFAVHLAATGPSRG